MIFKKALPMDIQHQLIIEQQQKEIVALRKELSLYQKWCARPKVLKEIIHHPARSPSSQNLLGTQAWDEYVYE